MALVNKSSNNILAVARVLCVYHRDVGIIGSHTHSQTSCLSPWTDGYPNLTHDLWSLLVWGGFDPIVVQYLGWSSHHSVKCDVPLQAHPQVKRRGKTDLIWACFCFVLQSGVVFRALFNILEPKSLIYTLASCGMLEFRSRTCRAPFWTLILFARVSIVFAAFWN
jgi:hypothetical protein